MNVFYVGGALRQDHTGGADQSMSSTSSSDTHIGSPSSSDSKRVAPCRNSPGANDKAVRPNVSKADKTRWGSLDIALSGTRSGILGRSWLTRFSTMGAMASEQELHKHEPCYSKEDDDACVRDSCHVYACKSTKWPQVISPVTECLQLERNDPSTTLQSQAPANYSSPEKGLPKQ